jgi:hypothetical protein
VVHDRVVAGVHLRGVDQHALAEQRRLRPGRGQ